MGCATALSNAQPAHVTPEGKIQAEMGVDVSISEGAIGRVVDAANSLDEVANDRALTDVEMRTILAGAGNLGFNPPALIPHVGLAYGLPARWEVGARFAASGWRLGVRRQLLAQDEVGIDLTVGIGFGLAAIDPPIHAVLDKVDVSDYGRLNIDFPLVIGRHGIWYRWWAGPRILYSKMHQVLTLTLPTVPQPDGTILHNVPIAGSITGNGLYFGGVVGAAFGYRWIFVGPELNLVQLMGDADVTTMGITSNVNLDAFVAYPSFTIMAEF